MIAKIIIGFFAFIGAMDVVTGIILRTFPKSEVAKYIIKNLSVKYNTKTYEVVD